MWHFLSFVFGVIIGSFLNAVIYRLPRENLSLVKPAYSICPLCGRKIRWYDNIPLISYILLGGRCRNCGGKISLRYPAVELCNGVGYLVNFIFCSNFLEFIALSIILSSVIVLSLIDLQFMLIPDITLLLIGAGSFVLWIVRGAELLNLVAVGLVTVLLIVLSLLYKGGMGSGDILLMAAMSLSLGITGSLYNLVFASLSGIIYALIRDKGKLIAKKRIPFGTFLAPTGYIILVIQKFLSV
ncbi:prepilin peptidase [Pseudothermotoga elfii]